MSRQKKYNYYAYSFCFKCILAKANAQKSFKAIIKWLKRKLKDTFAFIGRTETIRFLLLFMYSKPVLGELKMHIFIVVSANLLYSSRRAQLIEPL